MEGLKQFQGFDELHLITSILLGESIDLPWQEFSD
jgi:hypothetical protein